MRRIAAGTAAGAATVLLVGVLALAAQVGQSAHLSPTSRPSLGAVQAAAAGALESFDGVPGMSVGTATALAARPPAGTAVSGRPAVATWQALRARYFAAGSSADRQEAYVIAVTAEMPGAGGLSSLRLTTRFAGFGHAVVVARLGKWAALEGTVPAGTSTATLSLVEHRGRWQVSTMTFSDFSPV